MVIAAEFKPRKELGGMVDAIVGDGDITAVSDTERPTARDIEGIDPPTHASHGRCLCRTQ